MGGRGESGKEGGEEDGVEGDEGVLAGWQL